MIYFRIFLASVFIAIFAYTILTISNHGMGLIPIFFGDILVMGWPGQFNFDFMMFLLLSALWTVWRNKFTAKAFLLALFAATGGMLFLSVYLLYLSYHHENVRGIIIGE